MRTAAPTRGALANLQHRCQPRHVGDEAPTLYGSPIAAGLGHDEFLTLSPIVIGEAAGGAPRPSLVEGASFTPESPPTCRLMSVRRVGDYLFTALTPWANRGERGCARHRHPLFSRRGAC